MENFKKQLNHYIIQNPNEKDSVLRFIDFLEKYGNQGFYRENLEGHFTGSIIVVNKDITKTLLMHHKKLNKWLNFGGHADGEIDLENVAIRELEEESGIKVTKKDLLQEFIDLAIQTIPERGNEPEHKHYDVRYVIKVDDDIKYQMEETEMNDIQWFSIKELEKNNISPGVLKVIKKLKQY